MWPLPCSQPGPSWADGAWSERGCLWDGVVVAGWEGAEVEQGLEAGRGSPVCVPAAPRPQMKVTPWCESGSQHGVERMGCGASMELEAVLLSVGSPGEVGGLLGQEDAVPRPSCPWREEGRAGGPSDTAHYEATACVIGVP